MSTVLNIQAQLDMRDKKDGTGFTVSLGYRSRFQLQIGNVSVAFGDCEVQKQSEDYSGITAYCVDQSDDPVRLDKTSMEHGRNCAEKLLYALAADLGYKVKGPFVAIS